MQVNHLCQTYATMHLPKGERAKAHSYHKCYNMRPVFSIGVAIGGCRSVTSLIFGDPFGIFRFNDFRYINDSMTSIRVYITCKIYSK